MSADETPQLNGPPAPPPQFSGEPGPPLGDVYSDPDFLPEEGVFRQRRAAGPPRVERAGDVTVITLAGGRRDAEDLLARELDGATVGLLGCHVLLDLSNVTSLNGRELSALVALHRAQAASGGLLTLFNVNPWAHEVLVLTRLDALLCIRGEAPPPS